MTNIQPFDYQRPVLDRLSEQVHKTPRMLFVMATGLGKTTVAAFLTQRELLGKGRILFLCHDNDILEQCKLEFQTVIGNALRTGVFHGRKKHWHEVDILFASFQTFTSWKEAFFANEFDYIIVDEAHHSKAVTFNAVIDYFSPKCLIGMTATPDRMDLKDIREIYGNEVVNLSLEEAIANNWLANVEYRIVSDGLSRSKLKALVTEHVEAGKKVSMKQLNETIFIDARDEEVAKSILTENRKAIIFCESIKHAEHFVNFLENAVTLHSKKSAIEQEIADKGFRNGTYQHIIVVDKYNEGVDIPNTEMVVFLRCTDSRTIFLQQLGRGLRKIAGKQNVLVLDFVANAERILMIRDMVKRIVHFTPNFAELDTSVITVSGKGFEFIFDESQIELLDVLSRIQPRRVSDVPHLLAEYSEKNELSPEKVFAGTGKRIWWKCSVCSHQWQAFGSSRMQGSGCPGCAGQVATTYNNMTITHPKLAAEYSEKNELPPEKVIAGSNKRLWWRCSVCSWEWQTSGGNRAKGGNGCPGCAKQVVTPYNNITITHPHLAAEYSEKNELPAERVMVSTHKRILWRCSTCSHEWSTVGYLRMGCPGCSGRVATETNNITITHPKLAAEYSEKNELPPEKVIAGTLKKLWWRCSNCSHEWKAMGQSRVWNKTGCPKCAIKNRKEKRKYSKRSK